MRRQKARQSQTVVREQEKKYHGERESSGMVSRPLPLDLLFQDGGANKPSIRLAPTALRLLENGRLG